MKMAEIKLSDILSTLALIISAVSISWNIYRDIILKAKLRVTVQISTIVQRERNWGNFISVNAVNHGPGSIICESFWIRKRSLLRWLLRKSTHAFVVPDYTNPLSSQIPKELKVGERLTLLFPYKEGMFLANKPTHVGIMDSFGRTHWAVPKSLREATKSYLEKFPEEPWGKMEEKKKEAGEETT